MVEKSISFYSFFVRATFKGEVTEIVILVDKVCVSSDFKGQKFDNSGKRSEHDRLDWNRIIIFVFLCDFYYVLLRI